MDESGKSNIWFIEAYRNAGCPTEEGTYEAIGPHFRANPYGLEKDVIEKHGIRVLPDVPRNFEGIRDYLEKHNIEGIVFWKDGSRSARLSAAISGSRGENDKYRLLRPDLKSGDFCMNGESLCRHA